jgi:hypothetical protein
MKKNILLIFLITFNIFGGAAQSNKNKDEKYLRNLLK